MSAHVQQASMVSGRSMVLMVTVALHVAAIAALMTWRITEANSTKPAASLIVDWLDPDRPRPVPEPISNSNPLVGIPIPAPQAPPRPLEFESETALVGETVTLEPSTGSVDPGPLPVAIVETPLRFQAVRPSDDYYPPTAIRLEQQGVVILRVCADSAGRLSGRPRVVTGSRHRLLDDAAVTWAAEALRFMPATRDGAAIAACKDFRVNFTLH